MSSPSWRAFAWAAALMPFAFRPGGPPIAPDSMSAMVSLVGLALSLWALASLGRSFGIAPADRGLVVRGAYSHMRHPMYAGELLSYLGYAGAHGHAWNLVLWFLLLLAVRLRIHEEERLITGYSTFARTVRWRLLPGVW